MSACAQMPGSITWSTDHHQGMMFKRGWRCHWGCREKPIGDAAMAKISARAKIAGWRVVD